MPRRNPPHHQQRALPPQPQPGCRSKVRYITADAANEALYDAALMRPGVRLAVYQCLECYGWHLTSRGSTTPNLSED